MKLQCVLCNEHSIVDEASMLAKKLRNHPLTVYMCLTCNDRITALANERLTRRNKRTGS